MDVFSYNQILYNEAIIYLEQKWNRELTEHEKNLVTEGYCFGRSVEMRDCYSDEVIKWQMETLMRNKD